MVVLATKNGDDAEYVHLIRPKKSPIHHISLGTRRPLGISGLGRVLMSRFSDEEVCRLLRRINAYRAPDEPAVDVKAFVASESMVHVFALSSVESGVCERAWP